MKKHLLFTMCLILIVSSTFSQRMRLNSEVGFTSGISYFLGDLGGGSGDGQAFLHDLDMQSIAPAFSFIYREEIIPNFGFRTNLTYTILRGNDAYSENESRNERNLSFKSNVWEATAMLEYSLFRFSGRDRKFFTPYVFAGGGLFYFNPKAQYNDYWIELQPLGTEGQGLPQYPERQKYSRVQTVLPFGGGVRFLSNFGWVFGAELTWRLTSTDYLDDVSTSYPNTDYFFQNYDLATATLAANLSDRMDRDITPEYGQRGSADHNDTYFMGMLTATYHIIKSRHR
ncbi:MAG: hypothetical protein IPG60_05340 [Bacteroidetes bacterium]|nr:hypothetical protein [Bacteroidota bacterium]MBK8488552.1 hypothetical protein [Bacteroidota bacterium]MBP7400730.1 hypothetical protein [Chitinophagales bacterium]MBP9548447.1 hypothetical protein [Chitinophagales bacterium]MBP9796703.1 hypothetical protein [Chitinophagales bacterium]